MWTLMSYLQLTQTFNVRFWQRLINLFVGLFNFLRPYPWPEFHSTKRDSKIYGLSSLPFPFCYRPSETWFWWHAIFANLFITCFCSGKNGFVLKLRIWLDTLFTYLVNLDSNLFNNKTNSQKEFYMRSHEHFNILQRFALELGIPFWEYDIR